MSLRLRLTILYSALTGGILLVFGILLYALVDVMLLSQTDESLYQTFSALRGNIHLTGIGRLDIANLADYDMTSGVYIQVWGVDGNLQSASPGIIRLMQPLDPERLASASPVYHDSIVQKVHFRVLTVPLVAGGRPVGTLQLASNVNMTYLTRQRFLVILVIIACLSIVIAAISSWLSIGQALSPLATVTATAMQITETDDLSRRIPFHGSDQDEIGRLISAFNETLERLEQLFSSQQRFLADVSHELRTPLTVIKGNVDLIRKIGVADEESLLGIEEEADRMTRMVGDLLLETQAESGKLPLYFAPVELDTLMLEVFKEMRVLARERVQLKLTDIDQIMVNGDRDRLKQVLINLVSNAIKYTPQGGEIYMSLARSGDNARLIVRDTGQGIPSADLPHIFERFYRAEKSRSRSKMGGFGLGLSIAYWIVTNHGGRIEVNSAEGKGTTFCIWLPIQAPPGQKQAAGQGVPIQTDDD